MIRGGPQTVYPERMQRRFAEVATLLVLLVSCDENPLNDANAAVSATSALTELSSDEDAGASEQGSEGVALVAHVADVLVHGVAAESPRHFSDVRAMGPTFAVTLPPGASIVDLELDLTELAPDTTRVPPEVRLFANIDGELLEVAASRGRSRWRGRLDLSATHDARTIEVFAGTPMQPRRAEEERAVRDALESLEHRCGSRAVVRVQAWLNGRDVDLGPALERLADAPCEPTRNELRAMRLEVGR